MTQSNQSQKIGIMIRGEDPQDSSAFGICLGIDFQHEELKINTSTGAPDPGHFPPLDEMNPRNYRSKIIDVKQDMNDSNRNFYIQQTQSRVVDFWRDHAGSLCRILRDTSPENREEEINKFFSKNFLSYSNEELQTRTVDFAALKLDQQREEPEQKAGETGENTGGEDTVRTIEVSPVINVKHGRRVEELEPGTQIPVRVHQQSEEDSDEDEEIPLLPAEVISYQKKGSGPEGELTVKLQENIHGIAEAPVGSLIEPVKRDVSEQQQEDYEDILQNFIWLISALLVLILIFSFFLFF